MEISHQLTGHIGYNFPIFADMCSLSLKWINGKTAQEQQPVIHTHTHMSEPRSGWQKREQPVLPRLLISLSVAFLCMTSPQLLQYVFTHRVHSPVLCPFPYFTSQFVTLSKGSQQVHPAFLAKRSPCVSWWIFSTLPPPKTLKMFFFLFSSEFVVLLSSPLHFFDSPPLFITICVALRSRYNELHLRLLEKKLQNKTTSQMMIIEEQYVCDLQMGLMHIPCARASESCRFRRTSKWNIWISSTSEYIFIWMKASANKSL